MTQNIYVRIGEWVSLALFVIYTVCFTGFLWILYQVLMDETL